MSVNNKSKSAEDLVKGTKVISFMFHSMEYMHRPKTVKTVELLQDFLRAAGFHGVRLKVAVTPWVSSKHQMDDKSAVRTERWLSSWGSSLWNPPPRKMTRRDSSTIYVFFKGNG